MSKMKHAVAAAILVPAIASSQLLAHADTLQSKSSKPGKFNIQPLLDEMKKNDKDQFKILSKIHMESRLTDVVVMYPQKDRVMIFFNDELVRIYDQKASHEIQPGIKQSSLSMTRDKGKDIRLGKEEKITNVYRYNEKSKLFWLVTNAGNVVILRNPDDPTADVPTSKVTSEYLGLKVVKLHLLGENKALVEDEKGNQVIVPCNFK